uniref:2-succinyl-5-enolpyruvyl-6-hydroxy-3-cyclohexene-1-carboxylate synthase n=1 Tax=Cyanidium caldarium TaxID=2771 RepID=Q9TM08_CYACA|nr:2-succinyl-6-hydroxy-2,4-cyclohexadiene-1-carboxylate synthase [Cyanidium caldarium]AAF12986.1 unknown [Cyanidium caldarium]WDB00235.1 2-succinyl-6-hydroxy-2, 4-cyclohexadiene-1-carboxylate synthase [Cyanidium caldarium]
MMDNIWSNAIVEELVRQKITYFFIAPGSRSTLLALAVANNKQSKSIVHFDERSIGYAAVGFSKSFNTAAVIIVTSGTAVGNLLPCIIEASMSCIPLLVLSADRPYELKFCGANQSIDQNKIFGNFTRWFFEIPPPEEKIKIKAIISAIDYACIKMKGDTPGPVHINCLFREPFFHDNKNHNDTGLIYFREWIHSHEIFNIYTYLKSNSIAKKISIDLQRILNLRNGIIILGNIEDLQLVHLINKISYLLDWPILPDILSRSRVHHLNDNFINYYNLILKRYTIESPEVVLQFGPRTVSKELDIYLSYDKCINFILIQDICNRFNVNHLRSNSLICNPKVFCLNCLTYLNNNKIKLEYKKRKKWLSTWSNYNQIIHFSLCKYFSNFRILSEPAVVRSLLQHWPENYVGYLGPSMPIRDSDIFCEGNTQDSTNSTINLYSNRGASGIDGNIGTSLGISVGTKQKVLSLLGDLSFLHDINSLKVVDKLPDKPILVIYNNNGGAIFSFLQINNIHKDVLTKFFYAPHNLSTFEHIAYQFSLNYKKIQNIYALVKLLNLYGNKNEAIILEIESSIKQNLSDHSLIDQYLKKLAFEEN